MRVILFVVIAIGSAAVVFGAHARATASNDPCETKIEMDNVGVVWLTTCSSLVCPPGTQSPDCDMFTSYPGAWSFCMCSPGSIPRVCTPQVQLATGAVRCYNYCTSGTNCPPGSGSWVPRTDGSGYSDWVCPGC